MEQPIFKWLQWKLQRSSPRSQPSTNFFAMPSWGDQCLAEKSVSKLQRAESRCHSTVHLPYCLSKPARHLGPNQLLLLLCHVYMVQMTNAARTNADTSKQRLAFTPYKPHSVKGPEEGPLKETLAIDLDNLEVHSQRPWILCRGLTSTSALITLVANEYQLPWPPQTCRHSLTSLRLTISANPILFVGSWILSPSQQKKSKLSRGD